MWPYASTQHSPAYHASPLRGIDRPEHSDFQSSSIGCRTHKKTGGQDIQTHQANQSSAWHSNWLQSCNQATSSCRLQLCYSSWAWLQNAGASSHDMAPALYACLLPQGSARFSGTSACGVTVLGWYLQISWRSGLGGGGGEGGHLVPAVCTFQPLLIQAPSRLWIVSCSSGGSSKFCNLLN